jgi:hypothetical protein
MIFVFLHRDKAIHGLGFGLLGESADLLVESIVFARW